MVDMYRGTITDMLHIICYKSQLALVQQPFWLPFLFKLREKNTTTFRRIFYLVRRFISCDYFSVSSFWTKVLGLRSGVELWRRPRATSSDLKASRDVIHESGLGLAWLKFSSFADTASAFFGSLFTIHNMGYQVKKVKIEFWFPIYWKLLLWFWKRISFPDSVDQVCSFENNFKQKNVSEIPAFLLADYFFSKFSFRDENEHWLFLFWLIFVPTISISEFILN